MIQVDGLSIALGGRPVLRDVSFRVGAGEVVGLLGPNGAGKTTCIRALTGFLHPDLGSVHVAGTDLRTGGPQLRRQIGYLPEGAPLYREMRVEEHLRFRARLRGVPRDRRKAEVERCLIAAGVVEMRRQLTGRLSRGYRQRVGLADALLGSPSIVILDEPTAGLDPNQIRHTRDLIGSLRGRHTVVLSTHILSEVEAICSKALIIDQGRLVGQGKVSEICGQEGGDALGGRGLEAFFAKLTGRDEGTS